MYLVHLPAAWAEVEHWLFFDEDPRPNGCIYKVVAGVEFEDLSATDAAFQRSATQKMPVLARHERRQHYRLFSCRHDVEPEYVILSGFAFRFADWTAFLASPVAKDEKLQPIRAADVAIKRAATAASICISIRPEGLWWGQCERSGLGAQSRLYGHWLSATEFETEQGAVLVCPPPGPDDRRDGPVAWREASVPRNSSM